MDVICGVVCEVMRKVICEVMDEVICALDHGLIYEVGV